MEISLTLLPPRLIAERDKRRRRKHRIVAIATLALPVVLAYVALDLRIAAVQSHTASLERQMAPLRPVAAKVHQLEAEHDALRRREEVLSRLAVLRPRWSMILVQLSSLVPPDVWFTNLTVSNGQIFIQGRALSAAAVSTLSTRLASAPFMSSASLRFIREETVGGRRVLAFEIAGLLTRGRQTP